MKIFLESLALIYLFIFSLYHVITGIISVFFPKFSLKFYKAIYGVQPKETEQLLLTFKPWGNLALSTGVIGLFIFFNISLYFPLLIAFCLLLGIRIWYRTIFYSQAKKIFKITPFNNVKMIVIQLLGLFLFFHYLLPRL